MHGSSDHFLARAGFSMNQHGRGMTGHLFREIQRPPEGVAPDDQVSRFRIGACGLHNIHWFATVARDAWGRSFSNVPHRRDGGGSSGCGISLAGYFQGRTVHSWVSADDVASGVIESILFPLSPCLRGAEVLSLIATWPPAPRPRPPAAPKSSGDGPQLHEERIWPAPH